MNIKSKSLGIAGVFAYLLIIANTVSGLLLAPFVMHSIGSSIYGVYSTIAAFAGTTTVVDLGVTQTLIRYISNYKANKRSDTEIRKLCNTINLINLIVISLNILVAAILYFYIPVVYSQSFSMEEILLSQRLFILCSLTIIISFVSNYYTGIISGYGYFAFINITKSIRVLLRVILLFIFIAVYRNVYIILTVDISLSLLLLFVNYLFFRRQIKLPKARGFVEKTLIIEIAIYTFFLFMQNIVDQVNNHLDKILIGALVSSTAVAIYTFGLNIFHMFQNLSTSISQMLVPMMSEKIAKNATPKDLEASLTKIGMIQYMIVGAALFGFIAIGREFVYLWLGDGFSEVWVITLILMFGGLWPLIQNGAIAILKAKNLMSFRTMAIFAMAILNAGLTYYLVNYFGFVYAAVGTALGFILVNTIVMDIYYYRKLGLNMAAVVWNAIKKITPCSFVAAMVAWVVMRNMPLSWSFFLVAIIAFLIVYTVMLWYFVLDRESKNIILKKMHIHG